MVLDFCKSEILYIQQYGVVELSVVGGWPVLSVIRSVCR